MPEEIEIICENVCLCNKHQFSVPKGQFIGGKSDSSIYQRLMAVQLGRELELPTGNRKKTSVKPVAVTDVEPEELTGTTTTPSGGSPVHLSSSIETPGIPTTLSSSAMHAFIAANFQYPFKVSNNVSDEHIVLSDNEELAEALNITRKLDGKEGSVDKSGLSYIKLRSNEWTCPKPPRGSEDDDMVSLCFCQGSTVCDPDCPNRVCFIQCTARNCRPTAEAIKRGEGKNFQCGNKYFNVKRSGKPKFKVVTAGGKGMGICASTNINKGEYLIEYIGEVLTIDDWSERQKLEAPNSTKHFYTMGLGSDYLVDASRKGNESRLINHSCDPNLETQKWTDGNGESRIGLFAIRDIHKGEELTFNYQFETFASKPFKCLCGTDKCSGWIGGKTKKKPVGGTAADGIHHGLNDTHRRGGNPDSLPIPLLTNLSSPDIPIAVIRTDGTRKKEAEIQQEEIAVCNEKIDYFLQYIWANGMSGEEWLAGGRRCTSTTVGSVFNPGPMLALCTTKIEAQFIIERNILVLRNLNKARRDFARKFYVIPKMEIPSIQRLMEANWISDDICVRCRRTGNLVWCKKCVRSFHQCCVGSGDSLTTDLGTGEHSLTCRRCKRLAKEGAVPPIRMKFFDRYSLYKERRRGYWQEVVLPSLINRKSVIQEAPRKRGRPAAV